MAGESMWKYVPRHLAILCDLTCVFNSGVGWKIRSDARGISDSAKRASGVMARVARVRSLRYKQAHRLSWRKHQSKACERRGYCECHSCPGQGVQRWRPRETNIMRCEECSEMPGRDVFCATGSRDVSSERRINGESSIAMKLTIIPCSIKNKRV